VTRADVIRSTFPAAVGADLDAVLSVLPTGPEYERVIGPEVSVQGERFGIVSRLYVPEPDPAALRELTDGQRLVLACLYTRHHDGFVRERHVRDVRGSEPWLPVFTLQLAGEYVAEVCQRAYFQAHAIPREVYRAFADENPDFMHVIRQRVVSYSRSYPVRFVDYPCYRFLIALGLWEGPEGRRLIRGLG
jgi:hypothetical protein